MSATRAQFRGLHELVLAGRINMQWSPGLMEVAPPLPAEPIQEHRIRGMLIGLAIGDSLGNTTEGQLPSNRRQTYGEISDYLPNRYYRNLQVGLPSDDTQLAFWTLEHLLDCGHIKPAELARIFASRQIFGIG